jgi:serine O-acetyltransferase
MIKEWLQAEALKLAEDLTRINIENMAEDNISGFGMKGRVEKLIDLIRSAMFPNIYQRNIKNTDFLDMVVCDRLQQGAILLYEICRDFMVNKCRRQNKNGADCDECKEAAQKITIAFMDSLPKIASVLNTDIQAAYNGDPAAVSKEEILLSYPAFEAISIFRLAHRLFELNVPLLPRIMTEFAHQKTGIDIHPGATVGEYFFIDHGTGVVIGETCVIGSHVKIYQGVTLGAKSFELDEHGNPVKGIKRHPNIEDHVVIYSGATILGGDTVIGQHSVIGGNVWLMTSVEPYSTVYNAQPSPIIKK